MIAAVVALLVAVVEATPASAAPASAAPAAGASGPSSQLAVAIPLPTPSLPVPSLPVPSLPVPSLPAPSVPGVPLPGATQPNPGPPPPPGSVPGAPGVPGSPGGGTGPQTGSGGTSGSSSSSGSTGTADPSAAAVLLDPGADLYPQPPTDVPTTPQGWTVLRLNEAQHRLQYLQNVLGRTESDLSVAQGRTAVGSLLITLTSPTAAMPPTTAGTGSVAAADGAVLALSAALSSGRAELAARQAEVKSLQQQVNDSARRTVTANPAPAPAAAAATGYQGGRLRWPVAGPVVSPFGNRFDPYYHVWQIHAGVDIAAAQGTPIMAAAPGKVTQAGWSGGYGNYTCIDHGVADGQRLSTCYGHQSRLSVTPGQQVDVGQVIGYVGSTGASTGPHLHFEVRLGGRPVDPMPWL